MEVDKVLGSGPEEVIAEVEVTPEAKPERGARFLEHLDRAGVVEGVEDLEGYIVELLDVMAVNPALQTLATLDILNSRGVLPEKEKAKLDSAMKTINSILDGNGDGVVDSNEASITIEAVNEMLEGRLSEMEGKMNQGFSLASLMYAPREGMAEMVDDGSIIEKLNSLEMGEEASMAEIRNKLLEGMAPAKELKPEADAIQKLEVTKSVSSEPPKKKGKEAMKESLLRDIAKGL